MEAWYQTIGVLILIIIMAIACHKAVNAECYYCPYVKCIDISDCPGGCACIGDTGEMGSCMSIAEVSQ